jgi:serine/threonine protein phosphatase PrpC
MEPVYDSDYDHSEESDEDKKASGELQQSVAKINQDRGGVAYPYARSEYCALFGVFDGHGEGGEMVSQYALGEVQRLLEERLLELPPQNGRNGKKLEKIDEDDNEVVQNPKAFDAKQDTVSIQDEESLIKKAFQETFVTVDRGLLKESDIEVRISFICKTRA